MQQIKAILEIRYAELPDIFAYKKQILHKLVGDKADEQLKGKRTITENIRLKIENQKAVIAVQAHRTVITIEHAGHKKAQQFIQESYKKVWELLKLTTVDQVGYRCMFIEPSDSSFDDLVAQYKSALLSETTLAAKAVDAALPLTFKVDDYRINFVTGPMQDEELKSGTLEFPTDKLPERFSYVDLDFIKYGYDARPKAIAAYCADVHTRQKEYLELWKGAMSE